MHLPTNWLVLAAWHNYMHRASRLELPNTYSLQKKHPSSSRICGHWGKYSTDIIVLGSLFEDEEREWQRD